MKRLLMMVMIGVALVGCTSTAPKKEAVVYEGHPIAIMTMADGGVVEIEMDLSTAPNTVANFVALAESGFYDGLTFHRIIPGFMVQGGDPSGNGTGGPGHAIEGEFKSNGFANDLAHTRGVISMARAQNKDSAGSQFFIMHQDYPSLDGEYAAFGVVTSGMDVIDAIASVETGSNDMPKNPVVIKSITIDRNGAQVPEVQFVK